MKHTALSIVQTLRDAGFEAYWVGGCVRDQLLGVPPKDYDIATSARPEQIEPLFAHTIPVGRQFGVMLVIEDSHTFQVATFRTDVDYIDGRRPTSVSFCAARQDADRRDFTINGLFYDPISQTHHDWVGGTDDLKARIIRCIGQPEKRFTEDHLRILRAVRFAAQLGFEIEPSTADAATRMANLVSRVSAERISEELQRLFQPPHAARGLDLLRAHGLLDVVLPELSATIDCPQPPKWHPEGTVYEHIRLMLSQLPAASHPLLPWAVLLHDVAKPTTLTHDDTTGELHFYGHEKVGADLSETILARLRFPRKSVETVKTVVRFHMQFKDVPQMRKATLKRMLARPTFDLELALHRLDCLGSHGRLDHYEFLLKEQSLAPATVALPKPLVTGEDLLALGMSPGPSVGRLLGEIRERQLQEELVSKEQAIEFARARLPRGELPTIGDASEP